MRAAVVAALTLMASTSPASAQTPAALSQLLGSFANVNANTTYLPGSNGAVARGISDKMFAALSNLLGGTAPTMNFVQQIGDGSFHGDAHPGDNSYDVDPAAMLAIVNPADPGHSGALNGIPHEMAHLRQTSDVLASVPTREGGAQAFADLEALLAARAAGQQYDIAKNYDGAYADYVKQIMAQRDRQWITAGQFGK